MAFINPGMIPSALISPGAQLLKKFNEDQRKAVTFDEYSDYLNSLNTVQPQYIDQLNDPFNVGSELNPLLEQGVLESLGYSPENNPYIQQNLADRFAFDPNQNQLVQQAVQQQQSFNPLTNLSPEILQNPLLKALSDDVQNRIFENQAARGRVGSGSTAVELQNKLVPQALAFGQGLNQAQQGNITNLANLGQIQNQNTAGALANRETAANTLDQLYRAALGNRVNVGGTLENIRQNNIRNLFSAGSVGQNSAVQQANAAQSAANQISGQNTNIGEARSTQAISNANANNQLIGSLLGTAQQFSPFKLPT